MHKHEYDSTNSEVFKVKRTKSKLMIGQTKIRYQKYRPRNQKQASKALVFFSHGNKSTPKAHAKQAKALAEIGFTAITLELPNQKQWLTNGKRIAFLVTKLKKKYSDAPTTKVILVGHSFGGTAVSFAEGRKPQVDGLILLDPALFHKRVLSELVKIKKPVYLLGADRRRFLSKGRRYFRRVLGANLREISVIGATHNDAQYPSLDQLRKGRFQKKTKAIYQNMFLDMLKAAALDIAHPKEKIWQRATEREVMANRIFLHKNAPFLGRVSYALEQPAILEKILMDLDQAPN
jgi:dienelactone hydrolase